MAKRRVTRPNPRPSGPASGQAAATGLLTMPGLAAALGLSVRTLERLGTQGVIAPARPRRGSRASGWDLADCARRILAHRAQESPRDRRELAQAKLLELRFRREARQVLDRGDVVRRGQAVATVVTAHLTALPSRLVRDGIVPPEGEAAADAYIRDRLDELARLGDERYLTGGDDGGDDAEP